MGGLMSAEHVEDMSRKRVIRSGEERRRRAVAVALILLANLALSCAGPRQLARQSEKELDAGNVERAYELARRGVEKDASSGAALRAMTAAGVELVDRGKAEVLDAAGSDTLGAAHRALELRMLRAELTHYRIEIPDDPAFLERERGIVDGAAGIEYGLGEQCLAGRRPKEAYRHFQAAEVFDASYRDVQEKRRLAHERAMTRVAILPFENDVEIDGLSRALADEMWHEVSSRLAREGFEFTTLVRPDEVYASMTVKELDRLTPEAAWRVAGGIEARRVVVGRLHGLRSSTNQWTFASPIYHHVTVRDSAGSHERWVETPFLATARERIVDARWELTVLDVASHAELTRSGDAVQTFARSAWTDFRADGDCNDYRLVPPDQESGDHSRGTRERWSDSFGSWSLPDMLRRAREDRRRALYASSYRDEYRRDSRKYPVLCGELPSEEDMAYLAFEDVWRPVLAALKDLDAKD